jgi:hypothetical protein
MRSCACETDQCEHISSQLNFVVRAMIRVVFGTALEPGTHLEALEAYQKVNYKVDPFVRTVLVVIRI